MGLTGVPVSGAVDAGWLVDSCGLRGARGSRGGVGDNGKSSALDSVGWVGGSDLGLSDEAGVGDGEGWCGDFG